MIVPLDFCHGTTWLNKLMNWGCKKEPKIRY